MNALRFTAVLSTIMLLSGPAVAGYKWVKSENDFRQLVVDRKLVSDVGWSVAHTNGKLSGKFTHGKLSGSWLWHGRYFCRNGVIAGKALGTDCQKVEIDGSTLRMTRDKGKGKVVVWAIE